MKIALYLGGAIAGVVVMIVIVGTLLPRDHVAARAIHVDAPVDAVWQAITNVTDYPSWRRDVQRVELLTPVNGNVAWREHGKHDAIAMAVDSMTPMRALRTRITDDALPFGGTWTYALTPDAGGGTRVAVTEHGSVRNVVFRFVSRFIMGHTATIDGYLRALNRKFGGTGEPADVSSTAASRHGL